MSSIFTAVGTVIWEEGEGMEGGRGREGGEGGRGGEGGEGRGGRGREGGRVISTVRYQRIVSSPSLLFS